MSGIAGYLGAPQPQPVLRAMLGKMMHRGRDVFYHEEAPVYMGVRQLDRDNPEMGERAFTDPDRDAAVVFAGEFYNVDDEREALERKGIRFAGASVAEAVLRLYEFYGVSCVNRMRGAFAFAIHDPQKDLVFIARDPLGAQPLYYATTQSGAFVFASEIKALFEHPGIQTEVDLRGVDAYLTMGFSPGPDAMFKGVHKLNPGHRILWNPGLHVMIEPYWQWESFARPDPVLKSDADFLERFGQLFEDAVRRQSRRRNAGVLLSGDVESSAIAAVLAKDATSPVTAFCYDIGAESGVHSQAVAAKLGCKAETVSVGVQDMDKLPEVIWALDEPVADISLSSYYVVSRIAQQQSGTMMTGAGAADLFASLPFQNQLLNARARPKAWYSALKSLYALAPQGAIARSLGFEGRIGPRTKQRVLEVVNAMRGDTLWRQYLSFAGVMDAQDKQRLYMRGITLVTETFADTRREPQGWPSDTAAVMALEQPGGLTAGLLEPLEKVGMFASLSAHMPFMDHKLAEFLIGLPDHLRRTHARGKILLHEYMAKTHPGVVQPAFVPSPERRSMLMDCLAAPPLKDMVETCLSEASVRRREIFDWRAVRDLHLGLKSGEAIYARQVFTLLTLELWFRIFIDQEKGWISH